MLQIEGLADEESALVLQKALTKEAGVTQVSIDWCCGVGEVVYDPDKTDPDALLNIPLLRSVFLARTMGGRCC